MTVLTVEQAKSRFEEIMGEVALGTEIVLVLKNGDRVRVLPDTRVGLPERTPGALAGRLVVGDSFFEPLPEDELRGM